MTEQQINLLSLYKGWDTYQALLIKALAPLSSEELAGAVLHVYERAGGLKYGEGEVGQETVIFDSDTAHK